MQVQIHVFDHYGDSVCLDSRRYPEANVHLPAHSMIFAIPILTLTLTQTYPIDCQEQARPMTFEQTDAGYPTLRSLAWLRC